MYAVLQETELQRERSKLIEQVKKREATLAARGYHLKNVKTSTRPANESDPEGIILVGEVTLNYERKTQQ